MLVDKREPAELTEWMADLECGVFPVTQGDEVNLELPELWERLVPRE